MPCPSVHVQALEADKMIAELGNRVQGIAETWDSNGHYHSPLHHPAALHSAVVVIQSYT